MTLLNEIKLIRVQSNALHSGFKIMLVHELSTRLRFKLPFLREPSLDFAYLEATLSAMPGIYNVRINSLAASLVVEYNGKPATKQKIMDWCASLPKTHWPRLDST